MKLVDELFEIYRGRLQGTEEDLDMITLTVIEQLSRADILAMLQEMNEEELQYMFHSYLFGALKGRFAAEDNDELLFSKKYYH